MIAYLRFKGTVYVLRERALCSEIIHIYYDNKTVSHLEIQKILELIR